MTLEDWHQAQEADPVLSLVITRLRDRMLGKGQSKTTDPPKCVSTGGSAIICCSKRVSYTDEPSPENQRRPSSSWFCQLHKGRLLSRGCQDEVGHLGLECMLDLMHDRFFWPCMAAQIKKHIGKCCLCLAFKARHPKAPLKNIMATHPLELVHLDYLCLEPGKGLDENVLVVTDHFTRYAQAYVTKTQTTQMTAKTLYDKFIVHYGLPKKILMDQGQNFESVGG